MHKKKKINKFKCRLIIISSDQSIIYLLCNIYLLLKIFNIFFIKYNIFGYGGYTLKNTEVINYYVNINWSE